MEKSSKRGKIPQADWPLIMTRYEAGETLASIARTYDCSPPAISYIVSRSREKPAIEPAAPAPSEPQLIKVQTREPTANGVGVADPPEQPPVAAPVGELRREPAPPGQADAARERNDANALHRNGSDRESGLPGANSHPASLANGDQRPKLHLSLGNGGHTAANGGGRAPEPQIMPERPGASGYPPPGQRPPQHQGAGERLGQRPFQGPPRAPAPVEPGGSNGRDGMAFPEPRLPASPPGNGADGGRRKDNGAFIDQELRTRVDADIAAFLAAFDAALAADTQESRFGLREATDRLLRAGARTRIELERLEARVPLAAREGGGQPDPAAWRYRQP